MKKIISAAALLLVSIFATAQPDQVTAKKRLIHPTFTDTAAANTAGARQTANVILTSLDSAIQYRANSRWRKIITATDTAAMLLNANVVHRTGTESIAGAKTFTTGILPAAVTMGAGTITFTNGSVANYSGWTAMAVYGNTATTGVWLGSTTSNGGFINVASGGVNYGYSSVVNGTWGNNAVYIGGSGAAAATALLHLNSTTKGFLPPVMTATQGSAISSPAEGLIIYVSNTNGTFTTKGWWGYNGSAWQQL